MKVIDWEKWVGKLEDIFNMDTKMIASFKAGTNLIQANILLLDDSTKINHEFWKELMRRSWRMRGTNKKFLAYVAEFEKENGEKVLVENLEPLLSLDQTSKVPVEPKKKLGKLGMEFTLPNIPKHSEVYNDLVKLKNSVKSIEDKVYNYYFGYMQIDIDVEESLTKINQHCLTNHGVEASFNGKWVELNLVSRYGYETKYVPEQYKKEQVEEYCDKNDMLLLSNKMVSLARATEEVVKDIKYCPPQLRNILALLKLAYASNQKDIAKETICMYDDKVIYMTMADENYIVYNEYKGN